MNILMSKRFSEDVINIEKKELTKLILTLRFLDTVEDMSKVKRVSLIQGEDGDTNIFVLNKDQFRIFFTKDSDSITLLSVTDKKNALL